MPRMLAPIYMEGEAPGTLVFCPTCCEKTSCVTLNIRAATCADRRRVHRSESRMLKVNECQVCKCNFPTGYNFETATAFDFALLTSIVAMICINQSFRGATEDGFDANDVFLAQKMLGRYSAATTHFTEATIVDHARFLKHHSCSRVQLEKCLYPILVERLSRDKKYRILDAIEDTATPGLGVPYRQEAAKILKVPSTLGLSPLGLSIVHATKGIQREMDKWQQKVHQGCEDLVSGIIPRSTRCEI